MQRSTAHTVANLVLGAAGLAVAFVVLRRPPLRRAAGVLLKAAITSGIPGLLATDVRQARVASANQRPSTTLGAP